MNTPVDPDEQQQEAIRYARVLEWGARLGLIALSLSFLIYVSGWVAPLLPLDQLPSLWRLPLSSFLQRTGSPTGWGWLWQVGKSDLTNLIGISILSGCSLLALLGLLPIYWRRRDGAHALICALAAAALALAASGLFSGAHPHV